jgi:hypothetical protein
MPRILHFGFKFVWLVSAIAFASFAYDAYQSSSITLPTYQDRIPDVNPGVHGLQLGGVNFQEMITIANGIAESHNRSVEALQKSIHQSAILSFRLNVMCCFAVLVGLATQFGQYRHDEAQKANRKRDTDHDDSKQPVIVPSPQDSEAKHEDTTPAA